VGERKLFITHEVLNSLLVTKITYYQCKRLVSTTRLRAGFMRLSNTVILFLRRLIKAHPLGGGDLGVSLPIPCESVRICITYIFIQKSFLIFPRENQKILLVNLKKNKILQSYTCIVYLYIF